MSVDFKPIIDERGKRRFDKELVVLLRTSSSRYKALQQLWQHDPDVLKWCETHQEHWARLVKEHGYNRKIRG